MTLRDPMSKIVISANLGAYVFCYTLNYFIDSSNDEAPLPYVAIHLLSVHMCVVFTSFVTFIHLFINGFRLEAILSRASTSSLNAARSLSESVMLSFSTDPDAMPAMKLDNDDTDMLPTAPPSAYKVHADDSGYVNRFYLKSLVPLAEKLDVCVKYNHQIGEFINEGAILCYVWDAKTLKTEETSSASSSADALLSLDERVQKYVTGTSPMDTSLTNSMKQRSKKSLLEHEVEAKLGMFVSRGIQVSRKRHGELDVTLGIQQITDVAVRALSPGINDPHTAIQCMDVLSTLFATLGQMDLNVPSARDSQNQLRLCAPRRSFSHLVSMLDPIRRYGNGDLSVFRRALDCLEKWHPSFRDWNEWIVYRQPWRNWKSG